MNNYVTTAKAKNTFGVCEDTLRRWADNGLIKTPGGHRLYDTTGYIKTQNKKSNPFVIAESLPKVRKTICKDKSSTCKNNSQTIQLSQTLDQELILTEKVLDPSLNWLPKEESMKLWLPTEIDCAASRLNWFNGSFKSIKSNSWFSIKKWIPQKKQSWQNTSLQSSMFSIAESMEGENTKQKNRTNNIKATS